jgi:hypothetical protein
MTRRASPVSHSPSRRQPQSPPCIRVPPANTRAPVIDSNATLGLRRPNGAVFRVSDDPATPLRRTLKPNRTVRSPRLGHTAKS